MNATYKRSGTPWEGRYKAGAVDAEEYLLRVYRYIELNPVRANMVAYPHEYRWSSHAINAGGKANDWLKPHAHYLALGSGPAERSEAYLSLFRIELDPEDTARIRTAVNLGIGVGDARFREELEAAKQAKKKGGRKCKDEHAPVGEQADLF